MVQARKILKYLKSYVPGKPIEEVKRALGLKEVFKLASNENPFPPTYIRKAVLSEISSINRYPESGCFYLKTALAKKLAVKADQIIFGNGSDEIITMAVRAFLGSGDEVIIASPTFLIYEIQSSIQEARIKKIPLKNYSYDLDAMAKAVTSRTKIIFIANPDNPSGTYINQKKMHEFVKKINKDVLIFLDEAYSEFAPGDFPKTAQLLKTYKNIIFSRTFSKAYGLAGLRIGYGVADSQIIDSLNKVREPFNVNRFSQVAALAALKEKTYLKRVIEYTNKEKKYFYNQLTKLGVKYIESATNFVLIDFCRDTALLDAFMLKNGVIVRSLKGWGLANFIRVTVGLPKENRKFITTLAEFLKQE